MIIYAKLNNGKLEYAPKTVLFNERQLVNPKSEILLQLGYKEVITNIPPTPPEGFYLQSLWEEREEGIYQVWEEIELPPIEQTDAEYLLEKIGL